MFRNLIILFGAATGLLCSCRSTKKIQSALVPKDSVTVVVMPDSNYKDDSVKIVKENFNHIVGNRINYTTFSAKIDVDYQDTEGKKYNVNGHLRMYKDSIIWIVITGALGIEGLRAFISPDSVKILDKQNKSYIARSVSYLQEVSELPLDMESLQDLLVGNPIFLDSNIVSFNKTNDAISMLCKGEFFKNLLTIGEMDKLIRSCKLDDLDELKNRTCYLNYNDYENKKGVNFSKERDIRVTEKNKLDIKLNFKQYDFNETLSFPFAIPKNYKRN
ncbi:MAG: DUF4292 domain-containing protein [Chitinophagaceae bacterium]